MLYIWYFRRRGILKYFLNLHCFTRCHKRVLPNREAAVEFLWVILSLKKETFAAPPVSLQYPLLLGSQLHENRSVTVDGQSWAILSPRTLSSHIFLSDSSHLFYSYLSIPSIYHSHQYFNTINISIPQPIQQWEKLLSFTFLTCFVPLYSVFTITRKWCNAWM